MEKGNISAITDMHEGNYDATSYSTANKTAAIT